VSTTVGPKCHILRLKCTKFDIGWRSAPDPAGGAHGAPPDRVAGLRGLTLKGVGEGTERGEMGKGKKERREREGKRGGEDRGERKG